MTLELKNVKSDLTDLKRIRYLTRKVIPDALPMIKDGRRSIESEFESAANKKELNEILDDAVDTVTRGYEDRSITPTANKKEKSRTVSEKQIG